MNWLQRAVVSLSLKAASVVGGRTLSLTDPTSSWGSWGERSVTGKSVDDDSAMRVTTMWACIRVLVETMGSLPWAMYRRDGANLERVDDHALSEVLIDSPNRYQTDVEYREAKITNLCLRGNAYSLKETRPNGDIKSLIPVESSAVEVVRDEQNGNLIYKINDRGKWENYPQDKIWHWYTFSRNGYTGLSPISYARESLGLSMSREEIAARLYANGMYTSSVITLPTWMTQEQRPIAELKLQRMYQGLMNAGKPLILEGGMGIAPGIMPFVDAQFAEMMGLGIDDICRLYRVPPHMVAKLDRSTNNNIEHQGLEFAMYTILPYLTRIERSASKWLIKAADRGKFVLKFNVEGLLRADANSRAALYSILLQNGVLTRNEVRALENRNEIDEDGMNKPTVQSNMISIDDLKLVAQSMRAKRSPPGDEGVPA